MATSRRVIIGGNWKSNGSLESVAALVNTLNAGGEFPPNADVFVAPSYLHVPYVAANIRKDISVCVQDVGHEGLGAHTGDVAAEMVADMGLPMSIIGHSERRLYGETPEVVACKAVAALKNGITICFCCGESLANREKGDTMKVVIEHLAPLIQACNKPEMWAKIIIAYEPVWAIGTGVVATPDQAQETCADIRAYVAKEMGSDVGAAVRIMYGGSVNKKNCNDLIVKPDIDGFLVGGASLKPDFCDIVRCASKL